MARGDEFGRILRQLTQDQTRIGIERQAAARATGVAQKDTGQFDRIAARDQLQDLLREPLAIVQHPAVAESIAHPIVRIPARGSGQGGPEHTLLLVPDIKRLAAGIADRIVVPGRQAVLAAVAGPGEAGSRLGDQESEALVGDDMDPGQRRSPRRRDADNILPAIRGETPVAVVEEQLLL